MSHRLLLASPRQGQVYLARRGRLLVSRARGLGAEGKEGDREQWLKDRAAAFWLCRAARERMGPHAPWAILAPRGMGGVRIHVVEGQGLGYPVAGAGDLAMLLAFVVDALRAHGPLWLPWPLDGAQVDRTFGAGAWNAARQAQEREACARHAMELDGELDPANARGDRTRL